MLQPRTPTGQKLFVLLLQKCYSSKSISAAEETLMQSRFFVFICIQGESVEALFT